MMLEEVKVLNLLFGLFMVLLCSAVFLNNFVIIFVLSII